MSEWKARRFWKVADIRTADAGWEVVLDDRPLRTPGKQALILPTEGLAAPSPPNGTRRNRRFAPRPCR